MEPGIEFALAVSEAATHRARAQELIGEASRRMEYAAKLAGEQGNRFSVVRTVSCLASAGLVTGADARILQEQAQGRGDVSDPRRPVIPLPLLASRALAITGTGASGGYTVAEPVQSAQAALYPYMSAVRLGAQVLAGQRGNFNVPSFGTNAAAGWLAETGTGTNSEPVFTEVAQSPLRLAVTVPVSKQLLLQSYAEPLLSAHLLSAVGAAYDAAILAGTGANTPTGIRYAAASITTGTSFAAATAAAMVKAVAASNVVDENIAFVAAPSVRETLSTRAANGSGSEFLWRGGELLGRRAVVNTGVPAATLIAGDFTQLLLPLWNDGIALELDGHTNFQSDIVTIKATLYGNVALPRPSAFAVSHGIT